MAATACSAALTACHAAFRAAQLGECAAGLVAGVLLVISSCFCGYRLRVRAASGWHRALDGGTGHGPHRGALMMSPFFFRAHGNGPQSVSARATGRLGRVFGARGAVRASRSRVKRGACCAGPEVSTFLTHKYAQPPTPTIKGKKDP